MSDADPDVTEIKWMDLNEFLNGGFLQEANRQFFHPLGLALAVDCDKEGKVTGIRGLWDYRDDPEGMIFGEKLSAEKVQNVDAERTKHFRARARMFSGHTAGSRSADIQPYDFVPGEEDGTSRDK